MVLEADPAGLTLADALSPHLLLGLSALRSGKSVSPILATGGTEVGPHCGLVGGYSLRIPEVEFLPVFFTAMRSLTVRHLFKPFAIFVLNNCFLFVCLLVCL
jgi:hypothetical protein